MAIDFTPEKLARFIRWAVLALLAYALWHSFFSAPHTPRAPGDKAAAQQDCDPKGISPFENLSMITAPFFASFSPPVQTTDNKPGTGEAAQCGQHARLRYMYATTSGSTIFNNKDDKETTEDMLIGGGTMLRGFEQGLIGMKAGGERTMIIPPGQGFGAVKDFHALRDSAKFKLPKTVGSITAKAWLVSLSPALPPSSMEARVLDNVYGSGTPVLCGAKVTADIAVYKLDGTKLFSTAGGKPVTFTTGHSELPYGIEQAVLGMNEGGRRTVILPPAYDKPLDPAGATSALPADFALPPHEIVLVEIGVRAGVQEPSADKPAPVKPVTKK